MADGRMRVVSAAMWMTALLAVVLCGSIAATSANEAAAVVGELVTARRDDEPCTAEFHSWDYYRPGGPTDSYWMQCHKRGPHTEHENSETGATWVS